jgi:nanoRNase/pAp phosphatase (c-di-AMP/oligoRNAs hydrolase)
MNNGIKPILANEIASHFGGWGHSYAAGAKIKRNHHDFLDQVNEILEEIMQFRKNNIT